MFFTHCVHWPRAHLPSQQQCYLELYARAFAHAKPVFFTLLMKLQNKIFHLCPGKQNSEKKKKNKREKQSEEEKNFHLPELLAECHHTFIILPSTSSRALGKKISIADSSTGDLSAENQGQEVFPRFVFSYVTEIFSLFSWWKKWAEKKTTQLLPSWNTYCGRMLHALCQRIHSIDFLKWKISLRWSAWKKKINKISSDWIELSTVMTAVKKPYPVP